MKIVAIGGGHVGNYEDAPYDMLDIDKKAILMTGKVHPRLLFISFTIKSNHYFGYLKKNYMALGAQCERLGYEEFENQKTVESKFKRADIVYLGGGDTVKYMQIIRKYNFDKYIIDAINRNVVFVGISAGAIILHKVGSSDRNNDEVGKKYIRAKGLGFVDALFSPHYTSSNRQKDMPRILINVKTKVGIGVDNCAAVVYDEDNFEIVKSIKTANVYKCYYKSGKYFEKEVDFAGKIKDLISK